MRRAAISFRATGHATWIPLFVAECHGPFKTDYALRVVFGLPLPGGSLRASTCR
jgi:hypothetical protein